MVPGLVVAPSKFRAKTRDTYVPPIARQSERDSQKHRSHAPVAAARTRTRGMEWNSISDASGEGLSDYEKYHQISNAAAAQSGTSVVKLSRARKRRRDRFFGGTDGAGEVAAAAAAENENGKEQEDEQGQDHGGDDREERQGNDGEEEQVEEEKEEKEKVDKDENDEEEQEEEEKTEQELKAEEERRALLEAFRREESHFATEVKALGEKWHKTLAPFEDADHQADVLNISIKLRARPRRLRTLPRALSDAAIRSAFPVYTDSGGSAFAILSASDLGAIEEEIRHQRRCLAMKEASMGTSHPSLIPTLQKLAGKLRDYIDALHLDKKLRKRLVEGKLKGAVFVQLAVECLSLRRRIIAIASEHAKERRAELRRLKEMDGEGGRREVDKGQDGEEDGGGGDADDAFARDKEYSNRVLVLASAINDLAELRYYSGNFVEAEKGFRRAVEVVRMAVSRWRSSPSARVDLQIVGQRLTPPHTPSSSSSFSFSFSSSYSSPTLNSNL